MGLYSDAEAGVLTEATLLGYGTSRINELDAVSKLTPLIAAVRKGQTRSIDILLSHGADVNKTSIEQRTPLYWATWESGSPNRREIVKRLLADPNVKVDLTYEEVGSMTPLMNAVRNLQDSEVIAMLVDAGADPQAKNKRGQTAAKLAESSVNPKLSRALRPKHLRNAPAAETIDGIVDLLSHVAGANKTKDLEGMAQGALKNIFNWSGEFNDHIEKKINWTAKPPQTVEEYHDRINDYISSSELGKVFKPDDNFLQTVSQKAMELRNDKSTPLSKPENVERLVKLALYKPILFCDDSGSMGDVNALDTSASNQFDLVSRMTRISTRIIPDGEGVDVFFINSDGVKNARKKEVEDVMRIKKSTGITRIATKLVEKVLNPYIYAVLNSTDGQFQRPLLISILTDGAPCGEYDDEFENAIAECKKQLKERDYPEYAVIFQISQIGSDAFAKHFLKGLSARAENDKSLYCTGESLDSKLKENEWYLEEWLLKLLVAPIYRAVPGEEEENLWN